jgi:hypothetical protein
MNKTDISIDELVKKINRGELVLPEMQRRYVWTATKVRDLLDSLYHRYPTGSVLVWENIQSSAPTRNLDIEQESSPLTAKLLLLDGQQRLTSLAALMTGKPVSVKDSKRPVDILFNLEHPERFAHQEQDEPEDDLGESVDDEEDETEQDEESPEDIQEYLKKLTFVVYSKALEGNKNWVRVTEIFQKSEVAVLKQLGINSDDANWERYSERLQMVKAIKNYPYVMHILGHEYEYDEVTEIFVRVNSAGVKLRSSDLALAQITAKWNNSLKLFEQYARESKDYGYDIDIGLLVRSIVVFATEQSRFKTVGDLGLKRLQDAWEKAKKGLDFAVNFLKNNTQIESLSFLSSPFVLIPIAALAVARDEKLSKGDEAQLRRWLYLSHSFGHYSRGSSETILDADLNILMKKSGSVSDLIELVERQFGRLQFFDSDLRSKGKRSPLFPMAYLAIKQAGGKDWISGLALSHNNRGRSHKIEFHHVFPQKLLKEAGYEKAEINEIANMAFIGGRTNRRIAAKNPAEYLATVAKEQGDDALKKQFIPMDRELWKVENFRRFLDARRQILVTEINRFLEAV